MARPLVEELFFVASLVWFPHVFYYAKTIRGSDHTYLIVFLYKAISLSLQCSLYLSLSVCLFVSFCLSISLTISVAQSNIHRLSVSLSICLFVSFCLSVSLSYSRFLSHNHTFPVSLSLTFSCSSRNLLCFYLSHIHPLNILL